MMLRNRHAGDALVAIFTEMLNASCIAGLPWVASADGSISVQDHVADARREATAMLTSNVLRLAGKAPATSPADAPSAGTVADASADEITHQRGA
jgi:hypothetical protein